MIYVQASVNWLHSGIVLPLEAIDNWHKQGNSEKIGEILPSLILQSHSILNQLRDIQANILKDKRNKIENFPVALKELANIWQERVRLPNKRAILVDCPEKLESSELIKESLIAIANEAISNAINYSGVLINPEIVISVNVKAQNSCITLEVRDNGNGIGKVVDGYGIRKIKRIVSQLNLNKVNSVLKIITSPGNGFTLIAVLNQQNLQ